MHSTLFKRYVEVMFLSCPPCPVLRIYMLDGIDMTFSTFISGISGKGTPSLAPHFESAGQTELHPAIGVCRPMKPVLHAGNQSAES